MLALVGGKLIDGTGKNSLDDMTVLIEGKVIQALGPKNEVQVPENCEKYEVQGQTIMPGLIDTHVHLVIGASEQIIWTWGAMPPLLEHSLPLIGLKTYSRAKRTFEMGFTTLRDIGDIGYAAVAVRDAINQGIVDGPRLQAAGPYMNTTSGHGNAMPPWLVRTDLLYPAVDGVDSVLRAVRQSVKMNTDWIKFTATGGASINTWDKQQFNDEEMKTLINEAHEKARLVSAHCVWAKGTLAAVKLGADSVEHGCDLTPEIVELMIQKGTFLVPTLYAPQAIAKRGHEFGFSPERVESVKKTAEKHVTSFRLALEAGVKIALGTDAGYGPPIHGTNAYELQLLVENGMTPMQALMSATSTSAQLMRLQDKIGTVEKGKLADIIVVDGDPLTDITILQKKERIGLVMKEGSVIINRMGG